MNVSDAEKEEEGEDHLTRSGLCCRLRCVLRLVIEERVTIGPEVGLNWPECFSFSLRTLACRLEFDVRWRKVTRR